MKIDVKEPSQLNPNDDDNNTQPEVTNKLFQKGRPFGYYRKRNCVYNNNSDKTFCETRNCSSCDKINDPTRNCIGDGTCCSNERCARLMRSPDGLSAYTDVCMYETVAVKDKDPNGNVSKKNVVVKRQPIPIVKTITSPRNVYNNSKTYKKQPYSYSITEMIRNQKKSFNEDQKRI